MENGGREKGMKMIRLQTENRLDAVHNFRIYKIEKAHGYPPAASTAVHAVWYVLITWDLPPHFRASVVLVCCNALSHRAGVPILGKDFEFHL